MRKAQLPCMAALALIAGQSMAQEAAGPYVGGAIAQVRLEDSLGDLSLDASDTGFKLFGGYAFNENFAVELAYIDGGTPEDNIMGVSVEIDPSAIQASAIGSIPFSDAFSMYLRAALLSWKNDVVASNGFNFVEGENEGEDFSWGLGGSLRIGGRGTVRLEYEGADLDGTDASIISLGGLIKF
jgi:OmpA-OmpF porin, OOP family